MGSSQSVKVNFPSIRVFLINLFFVDFVLFTDGENGLPSLNVVNKRNTSSQQSASKKQLILSLDKGTWQVCGIMKKYSYTVYILKFFLKMQAISQGLGLKSAVIDPKAKNNSAPKRPRHQ
jgi:hypothetical protein